MREGMGVTYFNSEENRWDHIEMILDYSSGFKVRVNNKPVRLAPGSWFTYKIGDKDVKE